MALLRVIIPDTATDNYMKSLNTWLEKIPCDQLCSVLEKAGNDPILWRISAIETYDKTAASVDMPQFLRDEIDTEIEKRSIKP